MSLMLTRFPFRRRAGLLLFVCVAIFGAATVVFGVSRYLWLSLARPGSVPGCRYFQRHYPRIAAATGHAIRNAGAHPRLELTVGRRRECIGRV